MVYKKIGIIFAALLSTSCSQLEFVYTWSENFVAYEVDKFLDLTSDQESKVKSEFKKHLNLFLIEQEKEIVSLIQDYKNAIETASEKFDQKDFSKRTLSLFQKFGEKILPLTLEIADQLGADQIKNLENEIQRKEAKDLKKDQKKEIQKRLDRWLDMVGISPNADQKKILAEFASQTLFPFEIQRTHRKLLFQKFIEAHENSKSRNLFLTTLLTNTESLRSEEYQKSIDNFFREQYAAQSKVISMLTEKQKNAALTHMNKRLKDIEQIIQKARKSLASNR